MFACEYVYVCVFLPTCVSLCFTFVCVCESESLCVFVYVCVFVCMCVCFFLCMCVFVSVFVCVCLIVRVFVSEHLVHLFRTNYLIQYRKSILQVELKPNVTNSCGPFPGPIFWTCQRTYLGSFHLFNTSLVVQTGPKYQLLLNNMYIYSPKAKV